MPINFPNSPTPNQLYTYDDKTWEWNGIYWEVYSALTSYVTSTTFNYYTGTTQPLILNSVTGGSYSSGTLYLINNSGSIIPISGFSTSGGSSTVSGDYLPLSGGTVTGATNFTAGLTANTVSATTYQNLPIDPDSYVTGFTYDNYNINLRQNRIDSYSSFTLNLTGLTTTSDFNSYTASTQTTLNNKLDNTTFTAYTATTHPLISNALTGGTYSNGNITFVNNSGGTITITGSATYSSGILSGSSNWFSNGNGSVTLPTVLVALYNNSNFIEPLQVYTISSGITGSGGIAALTDNDTNYIYIEYNNGSPRWGVSTDNSTINDSDINLCYIIYRLGNFVHVLDFGNEGAGLPNRISNRIIAIDRFGRESGFELGLSGATGVITLTAGVAWNGTNRQSLVSVNSQDDIFFKNFHSGGTWTYTTTGDTINNTYYDDGTDIVLATASKYLVNWYFRGQEVNDHLYEVYGTDEYDSVAEAQLSVEPVLPELITSHAFLTGRIIVQVGATTGLVESAFVQVFQSTQVTQHNDLINIQGGTAGQYYHLTASQYSNNAYTNVDNNFSVGQTINGGLTADTVSATTYQNLPISGLTEGPNISITGSNGNFTVSFTGTTGTNFTGGTVSGATIFTNGLTANTISATTYSGDGSGLTNVQNIYNSDGTISSDRYFNISGSTLWFSGLTKGFQVRISDFGTKPGFIFTSDSLGGPSFSLYENGNILIEGPTEFQNTSQFSSTVSMINLSPDITSPYLLGLNNSSEVTTFDSGLLLNSITGGTYSGTTLYLNNNTGGTIQITGFTSGSGTVSGNGTANFLPKWTGSTGLGNSQIRDDGTTIGINSSPISGAFVNINDTTTASTSSVNIINNSPNKTSVSATGGNVGYFSVAFGTALTKSFEGYATNGTNAYGFYGVVSPDELYTITNGIGGYFEVSSALGYGTPTNRHSLQLIDGTEGLNKVLVSVSNDGKANWSNNLNVSAVTATTITSNSVKILPVALTVVSNTASTDASLSSTFTLTLTGNTTLATPTNGFSGQRILYQLKQDGTGSKLLTLSSGFRSGPITVTLSTAANTTDYLGVIYNAIDDKWDVLALNKGYS